MAVALATGKRFLGRAADPLRVGHDVVAAARGDRLRHLLGTHEVLADLHRRLQGRRHARMAGVVVDLAEFRGLAEVSLVLVAIVALAGVQTARSVGSTVNDVAAPDKVSP